MGRSPCCDKGYVRRGPWSPEEDRVLKTYIEKYGTVGNWIALPRKAGLRRCGKSCRLRWLNYLRPDVKHGGFTEEEDNIITSLYQTLGSRWSVIASRLPGRTDNDVKNYWNTKLKKRVVSQNQPKTEKSTTSHKPTDHIPSSVAPVIPISTTKSYERSSSSSYGGSSSSSISNCSSFVMESDLGLIVSQNFSDPSNGCVVSPTQDMSVASSSYLTVDGIVGAGGDEYDELLTDMSSWYISDMFDWCGLRQQGINGENDSYDRQHDLSQGFMYA